MQPIPNSLNMMNPTPMILETRSKSKRNESSNDIGFKFDSKQSSSNYINELLAKNLPSNMSSNNSNSDESLRNFLSKYNLNTPMIDKIPSEFVPTPLQKMQDNKSENESKGAKYPFDDSIITSIGNRNEMISHQNGWGFDKRPKRSRSSSPRNGAKYDLNSIDNGRRNNSNNVNINRNNKNNVDNNDISEFDERVIPTPLLNQAKTKSYR